MCFRKTSKKSLAGLVVVYVDDMLVGTIDAQEKEVVLKVMQQRFKVKTTEKFHKFVGFSIDES